MASHNIYTVVINLNEKKKKQLTHKQSRAVIAFVIIANIVLCLIVGAVLLHRYQNATMSPDISPTAQFIFAEWNYPDEYGQGIDHIRIYENSTGSWLPAPWYYRGGELDGLPFYSLHYDDPYTLNWSAGVAMRLRVDAFFNQTLVGVESTEEAKNYLQHSVTVYDASQEVFSQQNFTYHNVYENGNYYFQYNITLDFIPQEFTIYTVELTYEVFYESGTSGGAYLHDCSDTSDITYDSNSGLDPSDYDIGSNGSVVEIWIVPDSVADEKVIYKLDFTDIDNTEGNVNLTTRYKVEDGFIGFRLDLYYTDASYDSTGLRTSQTWENLTIDAESGKTIDYALLYCDDNPSAVSSGNRSVYIDFIEITSETGTLTYMVGNWNEATTLDLIFEVEISETTQWTFDSIFVITGMILLPVSTMYLVIGVKHDRSADRLYYGLIAFFIGWALIIATVVP